MPDTTTRRKPSRHADAESRLRALGPRLRADNPIVPLMLEMLDAARRDVRIAGDTPLARLYASDVAGRIPRAHLERLHRNLQSLRPETRARLTARPLRPLERIQPDDLQVARGVLDDRIARGVAEVLLKPRLPVGHGRRTVPMKNDGMGGNIFKVMGKDALADLDPKVWQRVLRDPLIRVIQLELPSAPVLDSVMPKKKAYMPGEKVTLRLRYPDWTNVAFKVVLSTGDDIKIDGQSLANDYATLVPKVLGKANPHGTRLHITLPADLAGTSWVRVEVTANGAKTDTNRVSIDRVTVPAVSPVFGSPALTAIKPGDGQLPGREVIVEGRNIGQVKVVKAGSDSFGQPVVSTPSIKMACHVRLLSPNGADTDVHLPLTVIKPSPLDGIGTARFTLPVDVVPGDYWLQLVMGDAPGGPSTGIWLIPPVFEEGPETLVADFRVKACKFAVRFDTIHCLDESDPETTFGFDTIDDEVFTECAIVADDMAWAKASKVFENFDDGETEAFPGTHAAIYPVGGGFGEVRVALGLQTELYETNDGDVQAWQKTMGVVSNLATKVGKLLLDLGQIKAAAIAAAVAAIAEAISAIAGLFGGSDSLGSHALVWTARELQEKTNNASRSFGGTLQFHNSDDDGSYDVAYTVSRLE